MTDQCPGVAVAGAQAPCTEGDDALDRAFHAVAGKFPPGWAWDAVSDPDALMGQQTLAIAEVVRDVEQRACALLAEWLCFSATETRPEWLDDYGLPDACGLDDLCAKLAFVGAASRDYFIEIAGWLGFNISIVEHVPFQCGLTPCGSARRVDPSNRRFTVRGAGLGGWGIRYVWHVVVRGAVLQRFAVGRGQRVGVGDPLLRIKRAEALECILSRFKPAHTRLVLSYIAATASVDMTAITVDSTSWAVDRTR